MDAVSERLKFARQKAKRTQEDLAQAIGTHKNTVGRWERGLGEPDAKAITSICETLGLSPYWLLSGEGPMLDKDRDVAVEAKPGMKAGDLGGYKLSEVRGGPAFDTSMAKLQAKWREIASALPEGREDADMEKAYLYHQIQQLEAELAETKEAVLKAKDEAIRAQEIALQTLQEQAARKQAETLQTLRSATTEELIEAVNAKGFTLEIDGKTYPKK